MDKNNSGFLLYDFYERFRDETAQLGEWGHSQIITDEVGFEVHEKLFGHDKPFLAVYSSCHFWPFIRAVIFGRVFTKMRAV